MKTKRLFKFTIICFSIVLVFSNISFSQPINPNIMNRVHHSGEMTLNITNWGYYGNYSPSLPYGMEDPEVPGSCAPQLEFPSGSDCQYLFFGSLWIGALIQEGGYEYPRVSTGDEGWFNQNELFPDIAPGGIIIERSNIPDSAAYYDPSAIANEEIIAVYTDTLTDPVWVSGDPIDGPHFPLGVEVEQITRTWINPDSCDIILFEFHITNIDTNYLKNIYLGFYLDSDIGRIDESLWWTDDISGFQKYFYFEGPGGEPDSVKINLAYSADGDGRPAGVGSGTNFYTPDVTGMMFIPPADQEYLMRTSFNWWMPNGDPELDYGPSWQDDGSGGWTEEYGTPIGDERKYFLLSNREIDFDQVYCNSPDYINSNPQILRYFNPATGQWVAEVHEWKENIPPHAEDIANGYDTRYLLSIGPCGIFDHIDEAGNAIYRLNPGEEFTFNAAYVGGRDFHNRNNPQPSNTTIDPNRYNFFDLKYKASLALQLFDELFTEVKKPQELIILPSTYLSVSNFPNPFNSNTTITYNISGNGCVKLTIYDLLGREVAGLVNEVQEKGVYLYNWDGCDSFGSAIASGLYFYSLEFNNVKKIGKMILLR